MGLRELDENSLQRFNVNDTTNTTITPIAAASAKVIRSYSLLVSVLTADTITVKFGNTTVIGPIYLGANSGLSLIPYPMHLTSTVGDSLQITKGVSTTNLTVFGLYSQE